MYRIASKPGPSPISCRTCRQRRKKCDLARPCCERCLKGGYECLGYEDNQRHAKIRRSSSNISIPPQSLSITPAVLIDKATIEIRGSDSRGLTRCQHVPPTTAVGHVTGPSVLGTAILYRMDAPDANKDNDTGKDSSENFDRLWPHDQGQVTTYSHPPTQPSACTRQITGMASGIRPTSNNPTGFLETVCQTIPLEVDATQISKEGCFKRIANEYIVLVLGFWMTPPSRDIHKSMANQVMGFNRTMQIMYLRTNLLKEATQDHRLRNYTTQSHPRWIDELESKLTTNSRNNPPLRELEDCLMAHLELVALKFAITDGTSGYTVLRNALPKFLQLAAANSDLLVEQPRGNLVISFPRILGAPWYELVRFALYDVILAFLLGLPHLAEYGHDGECDPEQYKFEWMHGIPVGLLQVISQVNSWRAGSRNRLDDWQTLEQRVLTWKSPYAMLDGESLSESASFVRTKVHEGWRHVVLIYIYMGICGVSSLDLRVQTSVDQIIQLMETIGASQVGIHMLPHCVIAGLAARLERHRIAVYSKLILFKDTRVWLFSGPQFNRFLCRLWHGVGTGGGAVTWSDYVQARGMVLPI